jgi:hypothetical protein
MMRELPTPLRDPKVYVEETAKGGRDDIDAVRRALEERSKSRGGAAWRKRAKVGNPYFSWGIDVSNVLWDKSDPDCDRSVGSGAPWIAG